MNVESHSRTIVVIVGMKGGMSLPGGLLNTKEEAGVSEALTNIVMATPLTTIKTGAKETPNKTKWTSSYQEREKMSRVGPNQQFCQVSHR